jgi:holin-like protein
MPFRSMIVQFRRALHRSRLLQVGLLFAFWLGGEGFARLTGLPVPGGIVGMLAVLALLSTGRLSVFSMRRGADWFIADMLLFFVPAVLGLLDHREFLSLLGLKLLVVILTGTVAVMAVTALTVDLCSRWISTHGLAERRPK